MFTASKNFCTARRAAIVLALVGSLQNFTFALEIKLPAETATLVESPLPGFASAQALCGTCHSADYVHYQPVSLGRAWWKTEVTKMQKTFGAPIPATEIDPLVDYLVKTYGVERRAATPAPAAKPAPETKK